MRRSLPRRRGKKIRNPHKKQNSAASKWVRRCHIFQDLYHDLVPAVALAHVELLVGAVDQRLQRGMKVVLLHTCCQRDGKAVSLIAPSDTDEVAYFELGTIRVSCAAADSEEGGSVLVLSPWLAYPAGDTVFFEELSRKSGSIKGIFQAYFSARTKNQLLTETEERISQNIIEEINADLALGKVSDIYFTDYLFLE